MQHQGMVLGLLSLMMINGCGPVFLRGSTLYGRVSDPLAGDVLVNTATVSVALTTTTTATNGTLDRQSTKTSSAAVTAVLGKIWGVTVGVREEFGLDGDHYRSFTMTYLMKGVLQFEIAITRRKEHVLSDPSNKAFKVSIADISLGTRDETRRYIATPVLSFLVVECSATWLESWFLTIDGALYLGSGYSFNIDWRETDVMTDMDPTTNDAFSVPTKLVSEDNVTGHFTLIGNIGLPHVIQLQIVSAFIVATHDSRFSLGAGIKW